METHTCSGAVLADEEKQAIKDEKGRRTLCRPQTGDSFTLMKAALLK